MDVKKFLFSNFEEVAVLPLTPEDSPKMTNSISSLMSKNEDLRPLTVVFNSEALSVGPGDSVFLRPESYSAAYMNMIYQVGGTKFVLIPKSAVIVISRKGS